jgi:FkbM family methyltransferase
VTASLPFKLDLNDPLSVWRSESFWSKEVETIKWLDFFSECQDYEIGTLIDVGANIGIYSLYWLSLNDCLRTVSCEPFSENLRLLKSNVHLNGYEGRVKIVENPLYSELADGLLDVKDHRPGSSGSQFNSIGGRKSPDRIRVAATTLDKLILDYSEGYILKIDVDGLDFEILKGGVTALKSGCVRSILIEAPEEIQSEIADFLQDFTFFPDKRFNEVDGHSDSRRKSKNTQERNRVYTLNSTI